MSKFIQRWHAQSIRSVAMIVAGIAVAGLSNVALDSVIRRDSTRVGIGWMLAGMTMIAVDFFCRFRATEPPGLARFLSGMGGGAGGAIRAFPIWSIGTGTLVLGLLYLLRII